MRFFYWGKSSTIYFKNLSILPKILIEIQHSRVLIAHLLLPMGIVLWFLILKHLNSSQWKKSSKECKYCIIELNFWISPDWHLRRTQNLNDSGQIDWKIFFFWISVIIPVIITGQIRKAGIWIIFFLSMFSHIFVELNRQITFENQIWGFFTVLLEFSMCFYRGYLAHSEFWAFYFSIKPNSLIFSTNFQATICWPLSKVPI